MIYYASIIGLFISGCGIGFLIGWLKYRVRIPESPAPNYLGGHTHTRRNHD